MLDQIIRFSIKNKLIIGIFTVMLVLWGVYSFRQLPIDALPDITNNQVQIITTAPSQSAGDIERLVTFPVEQSVATIPGITEVRSFSRFGLSVVTVVFKDEIDGYWARQQVNERLSEAKEQIPPGVGTPRLAPVTTGLGEIYQYVLHTKKGYENKYDAMELRSIQDWIVRRQLLGVEGVADVSSFGGYLKQYEITVNTDRLRSMNVTIAEVQAALEKNNQNTGGGYIDNKPYAYYIRSQGLVENMADIERIVVRTSEGGIPVLIRDIGTVQFGHAVRYGAMTRNAEGEVVGAVVMMLKGGNSSAVIERIKERIAQIEKTLPEGVVIEPFLDRTKLVDHAISTVTKNLIEGALIVIFVLVLLLGNLRAGLIVASVIPLAMLFAISLMNVFGVSGNLMSLGAIDFGLIVDGAVIIVEATMHHIAGIKNKKKLTQAEMDEEVYTSASRIRTAAAFGEIIILIVYLPILALQGVEGKMFKPMAQTVSFAIIGAFILSLTYVPMMSALALSKNVHHKRTISDRIIGRLHQWYHPILRKALVWRKTVVAIAIAAFLLSLLLFNQLGAEFLPSLDEGDFAVETRVMTGSSILETADASQKAAAILLKKFPDEVKEVIAKIGSSEIPTDPMPMEAADLMVVLKDKDDWKAADNREELAEKMTEALEVLPGVSFGFQQPIQMRFNELMTGARQDVVVKIYGEDLDLLAKYANELSQIVGRTEGAKDIAVEQATGQPQIVVRYNRDIIARYGLNIRDINSTINAAFAGQSAGQVYEQERRFDLVVRLDSATRKNAADVGSLNIPTPGGMQVPLSQVATVRLEEGANQIQRDDAKRRITVGFNVRGRDVESIVQELQGRVASGLKMQPGYYVTYGGSFENLQQARARLSIAVPVALLLIFLLLYFTFGSVWQGLLIYSAIPLSAIGGIVALWLRDMPFSISAGVGFIALFGVSVLNGIVLIAEFNRLRKEGLDDNLAIIMKGTHTRLRPVIMTAAVASLGFLPMALSSGSGAEVQKPLATVVIGGLVSATLLTLIVLPALYAIFAGSKKKGGSTTSKALTAGILALLISFGAGAQPATPISFEDLYDRARGGNLQLRSSDIAIQRATALRSTALTLPKTGVFAENEDLRPSDGKGILKIGLSQTMEWPGVYVARRRLYNEQAKSVSYQRDIRMLEVKRSLQNAYYTLWYHQSRQQLWQRLDSLYTTLANAAVLRVRTGESAGLDSISAKARSAEINVQLRQIRAEMQVQQSILQTLLNTDSMFLPEERGLEKVDAPLPAPHGSEHPALLLQRQSIAIADADLKLSRQSLLPDFQGRFFSQKLYGLENPFSGFSVSVGVPILGLRSYGAKLRASSLERDYQQSVLAYESRAMTASVQQSQLLLAKDLQMVDYYETTGLAQAEAIIKAANLSYRAGEISFAELSAFLTQAIDIRKNYLDILHQYNQSAVALSYYLNQ